MNPKFLEKRHQNSHTNRLWLIFLVWVIVCCIPLVSAQECPQPSDFFGWVWCKTSNLWENWFSINPIIILKAEHLDSDKNFISDIYLSVYQLDNSWSETINDGEYVRVTFEKNLTNLNDITIYARSTSGSSDIEVYKENSNDLIANFENIIEEDWYKIYLTNLTEETDVFDLKVLGSIEFDYIVDPDTEYPQFSNMTADTTTATALFNVTVTSTNRTVILNLYWNPNQEAHITASNTSTIFNASYNLVDPTRYCYNWTSYGNGTSNNVNYSDTICYDWVNQGQQDSSLVNITLESTASVHSFTHLTINNVSTNAPYNSLVGYWNFDGDLENTKLTKSYDWSSNNFKGTGVGDALVNNTNCLYGDCAKFDGSGDYIWQSISGTNFNNYTSGAVSFWVKISANSADQTFFSSSSLAASNFWIYMGYKQSTNKFVFSRINGATEFRTEIRDTTPSVETWYHIVWMSSGSATTAYLNGQAVTLNTTVGTDGARWFGSTISRVNWIMGARTYSSAYYNYLNGSIDEIMIFNTTLTAAQVLSIYNNQSSRFMTQGTQDINNQSYMNITAGNNRVNITTTMASLLGSNISMYIGYFEDGNWYYPSFDYQQNVVSGVVNTFNITINTTGISIDYIYNAGNLTNPFYSPLIESYSWNVWNYTAPSGDTSYPTFNYYTFSVNNNSQYALNQNYQFNTTITSTNGTAGIEWAGTNYTLSNISSVFNKTFSDLSAGTYSYYWWAYGNGTKYLFNNTQVYSYTVAQDTTSPSCVIVSRTPADINDSSSGIFSVILNCSDASGINVSLAPGSTTEYNSFITRTLEGFVTPGLPNRWSIRPPANNIAQTDTLLSSYGQIFRSFLRGESSWFEFLGSSTMNLAGDNNLSSWLLADNYSYAVGDGRYGYYNITNTSATTATINYTMPSVRMSVFRQNIPLSYESLITEQKKNVTVGKNTQLLVYRNNLEAMKGTQNYTITVFKNVGHTSLAPTANLRIFYCNSSYSIAGGVTPITSPNCVSADSVTATNLDTKMLTTANSSYVSRTYSVTNGKIGGIVATPYGYYYYDTLEVATSKNFLFAYANGTTNTNVSFANTNRTWTSTNSGASWTPLNGTLDLLEFTIKSDNDEFQFGYCVYDKVGNIGCNKTVFHDDITATNHPISNPAILTYNSTAFINDQNLNETHKGTMNIRIACSRDPDSVGNVTHNLTLRNNDGTLNYTINASFFCLDDAQTWINFDTSLVPSSSGYRMNLTATSGDNNLDVQTYLTYNNFTIDNAPPYFTTIPASASAVYGTIWNGVTLVATDNVAFGSYAINDTTNFKINSSGFLNWTGQLGVGNYYVNVTINDSVNNLNSTIYNLNITQATSQTSLTFDKATPQEYPTAITPTCSLITGVGSVSLTNGTSGVAETLGAGTWTINCSYAGNTNYTASSNTTNYVINKNSSLVLGLTATTPITYPIITDFVGSGCPAELSCYLNISNGVYGVGTISANYSTAGNTNYSATSTTYTVTINQNTSATVYNYLNNSRANITIYNNTNIWLNATLFNVTGIINLYNNGTLINSGNSPISNLTDFNATGIYNITAIYPTNTNYSGSSETWWVNVTTIVCIESLQNTSWSDWINITCLGDNTMNQSRNLTQYDSNNCGYANETFYEYRHTLSCDATPPTWTNLRNFTHNANTSFSQSITATDISGISSYWLNDTTYFSINSGTGLITNITNLSRQELHWLNISVNDTLNNIATGIFYINITPYAVPTSKCNSTFTLLKTATSNIRPYGQLCFWRDFR